ncbi:MAG: hypothetical protein WCO09_05070 [bacterium]
MIMFVFVFVFVCVDGSAFPVEFAPLVRFQHAVMYTPSDVWSVWSAATDVRTIPDYLEYSMKFNELYSTFVSSVTHALRTGLIARDSNVVGSTTQFCAYSQLDLPLATMCDDFFYWFEKTKLRLRDEGDDHDNSNQKRRRRT